MSFHDELEGVISTLTQGRDLDGNTEALDAIITEAEALAQVSEETLAAMVERTFAMVGELREGLLAEAQKLASL